MTDEIDETALPDEADEAAPVEPAPDDDAPVEPAEAPPADVPPTGPTKTLALGAEAITTLSVSKRRIGLRIVPFNVVAEHPVYGALMFEPGAFGQVDPRAVRLRMDHEDPPTGLGVAYSEAGGAAHMEFAVSRTGRGDEQLTLAADGVSRGASVGYSEVPGRPQVRQMGGRLVTVYPADSVRLGEVSTTWMPTFVEAGVTYMLAKKEDPVTDQTQVPQDEAPQAPAQAPAPAPIYQMQAPPELTALSGDLGRVLGAFEEWREEMRRHVTVPGAPAPRKAKLADWAQVALQLMRGQAVSPTRLKELALDDVVTGDNPGAVPTVLVADFDDLINASRPFINSLRRLEPPTTGMSLIVPAIESRGTGYTQSAEKADLTGGTAPKVGTITFPYDQVFGGADVAIQLLNRGDRSFFDLLTQLLAEAYALDAEAKAVDRLLTPAGTTSWAPGTQTAPQDGGTIDPGDLQLGAAWQNSIEVYRRAPDTIWLNAAAVAAFIDAKDDHNAPLYSNLAAAFTAGTGPGGVLSGLTPVYVPALDDAEVDVIVGPARSYVYAEDPARTLQVDVPGKAGRDIALVGGFFFGPRYPSAFTTYTLGS